MKEDLFLEGVNLLLEEAGDVIVFTLGWDDDFNNVVKWYMKRGKTNTKETPLSKMPKPILTKILKTLNIKDKDALRTKVAIADRQGRKLRVAISGGGKLRVTDDGKEQKAKKLTDSDIANLHFKDAANRQRRGY